MLTRREGPNTEVDEILASMTSPEKDSRSMALIDLLNLLNDSIKNKTKIDSSNASTLADGVLSLLSDKFMEVRNNAVQCVGPLAAICGDTCRRLARKLCQDCRSDSIAENGDESKSVAAINEFTCLAMRSLLRSTRNTLLWDDKGGMLNFICTTLTLQMHKHTDYVDLLSDLLGCDEVKPFVRDISAHIGSVVLNCMIGTDENSTIENGQGVVQKHSVHSGVFGVCMILTELVKINRIPVSSELDLNTLQLLDRILADNCPEPLSPNRHSSLRMQALHAVMRACEPEILSDFIQNIQSQFPLYPYATKLLQQNFDDEMMGSLDDCDISNVECALGIHAIILSRDPKNVFASTLDLVLALARFCPNFCGSFYEDDEIQDDDAEISGNSQDEERDDQSWRVRKAALQFMDRSVYWLELPKASDDPRLDINTASNVRDAITSALSERLQNDNDGLIRMTALDIINNRYEWLSQNKFDFPSLPLLLRIIRNTGEHTDIKCLALTTYSKVLGRCNHTPNDVESVLHLLISSDNMQNEPFASAGVRFCKGCLTVTPVARLTQSNIISLILALCTKTIDTMASQLTQSQLAGPWRQVVLDIIGLIHYCSDTLEIDQVKRKELFHRLTSVSVFYQIDEIALALLHCAYTSLLTPQCKLTNDELQFIVGKLKKELNSHAAPNGCRVEMTLDCLSLLLTRFHSMSIAFADELLPIVFTIFSNPNTPNLYCPALGLILVYSPFAKSNQKLADLIAELICSLIQKILTIRKTSKDLMTSTEQWTSVFISCLRVMEQFPHPQFVNIIEDIFALRSSSQPMNCTSNFVEDFDGPLAIATYIKIYLFSLQYTLNEDKFGEKLAFINETSKAVLTSALCSDNTKIKVDEFIWHRVMAALLTTSPFLKTDQRGDCGKRKQQEWVDKYIRLLQSLPLTDTKLSPELLNVYVILCEMGLLCQDMVTEVKKQVIKLGISYLDSERRLAWISTISSALGLINVGCSDDLKRATAFREIGETIKSIHIGGADILITYMTSFVDALTYKVDVDISVQECWNFLWSCPSEVTASESVVRPLIQLALRCPSSIIPKLCNTKSISTLLVYTKLLSVDSVPFCEQMRKFAENTLPQLINGIDISQQADVLGCEAMRVVTCLLRQKKNQWNCCSCIHAVLKQAVIKKNKIKQLDIGPFKHTVDEGVVNRKAAYQCLNAFVSHRYMPAIISPGNEIEYNNENDKLFDMSLNQMIFAISGDPSIDIRILSHQAIIQSIQNKDSKLKPTLSKICESLKSLYDSLILPESSSKNGYNNRNSSVQIPLVLQTLNCLLTNFSETHRYLDTWIENHDISKMIFNR